MKIKAAIFDMDGTLIYSLSYWEMIWKKLGQTFLGVPDYAPPAEVDAAVRTLLVRDVAPFVKEKCHLSVDTETLYHFFDDSFPIFYRDVATLKGGVVPLLDYLRDKGVRMCVASATELRYLRPVLGQFGIDPYFDHILSCSTLGVGKDQPDVYLHALEALGTAPEETALFEDSIVALRTGNRLGLYTVAIYDQYNYHQDWLRAEADHYVADGHTMDEMIPIFDAMA